MKRLLCLVLVLVMALSGAALAQNDPAPLALAEIEAFNQALLNQAIKDKLMPIAQENAFAVLGDMYELQLSTPDLSFDSVVDQAAMTRKGPPTEGLSGPRGTRTDMTAGEVLSLFPNDNPFLSGSQDAAVLYIRGELPAAVHTGFVLRDGQRLMLIEYDVYYQTEQGVTRAGLQFTLDEGEVSAIRSFISASPMSQEEARESLAGLRKTQEQTDYLAYQVQEGSELTREDMTLAGLDFFDVTPETAIAVLGEPANQEEIKDGENEVFISQQWPGLEIMFEKTGEQTIASSITLTEGRQEGPRGIRMGDSLAQIISLFQHGSDLPLSGGALYGDAENQTPPYGALVTRPEGISLYYVISTERGNAALIMDFIQDTLVSMTLSYL